MDHRIERRKKLIRYVVPSTLAMVSIFLFTVVDGIFVGQGVGTDGVGAVNIAFPFVMIFTAVEMMVSVGGLTVIAIRKGRGDIPGMNQAFMHSFLCSVVVGLVFTILATVFTKPMAKLMGANDTFLDLTCEYLFWYGVFMLPIALTLCVHGAVRNDGDPMLVSVSTIISTAMNIFGDWLLVFPLHMGLKGAAIATGVSQTAALLICLSHFAKKKGVLRFGKVPPDKDLCKLILKRGLPECVSQFNPPIVTILYNYVLLRRLGDAAENAYAVICYVACFAVAVFCGVAEGLQPLFGNCYGEGEAEDLVWYRRKGLTISVVGALVIYFSLFFVGDPICRLYGVDGEVMELISRYMPQYSLGYVVQAVTVIISAYLYSTTRTKEALTINILRSFVVDTVVILGMPVLFGAESVWYAFAVYEAIVAVIAVVIMKKADSKGIIAGAAE